MTGNFDQDIIDSEFVKSTLTEALDTSSILDTVKVNADISAHTLKPEDFYDDVPIFDDGNFDKFEVELTDVLSDLNRYITAMENVDADASLEQVESHLNALGMGLTKNIESLVNSLGINEFLEKVAAFFGLAVSSVGQLAIEGAEEIEVGQVEEQNNNNGGSNWPSEQGPEEQGPEGEGNPGESGPEEQGPEEQGPEENPDEPEEQGPEENPDEPEEQGPEGEEPEEEEPEEQGPEAEEEPNNSEESNEGEENNNSGISGTGQDDPNKVDGNSIVEEMKDENGNTIAVAVVKDGKKTWYQVIDGQVIVPKEAMETFNLPQDITITVNGQETTIPKGSYSVDQVIYNADGSIRGVRIIAGDNKIMAYLDPSGNVIKADYVTYQNGMCVINNPNYNITDIYGNSIGKFKAGEYNIYDVMYDSKGNAVAYRLSPDGEYEQWLYLNGNTADAEISLYNETQPVQKSGSVSMFEKNKGLLGLLGVLFVALGGTLVARKKVKDREESSDNSDDDYVEEKVPAGSYGVYDVKRNEEGAITQARINPLNSTNEIWVEV